MTATIQNPTIGWNPDASNARANGVNRTADAINTNQYNGIPFATPAFNTFNPTLNPINQQFAFPNFATQMVNTPYGPMPVAATLPTFATQIPWNTTQQFAFSTVNPLNYCNPLNALGALNACTPIQGINAFNPVQSWNTLGAMSTMAQPTLAVCPITGQCTIVNTTPTVFGNGATFANPINPFFRPHVQCTPIDAVHAYANSCHAGYGCAPLNGFATPTSQPTIRFAPINSFVTSSINPTLSQGFPNSIQNAYQTGYASACATTPNNVSWFASPTLSNPLAGCVTC